MKKSKIKIGELYEIKETFNRKETFYIGKLMRTDKFYYHFIILYPNIITAITNYPFSYTKKNPYLKLRKLPEEEAAIYLLKK